VGAEPRLPPDGPPRGPQPDYFQFFDLPRNLAIDAKDLEERFYALSRKWHPDLFARKSPREQETALEASAILNDAYRTLKDPIARAMYLLKLEGFEIGEQGAKDVPPELLEEIFELNMALEEDNREAFTSGPSDRFSEMRGAVDAELQEKFDAWDRAHDRSVLAEIRGLLNRRKYISNLIGKANVPDRL
jgi:molecular chaperone HscB